MSMSLKSKRGVSSLFALALLLWSIELVLAQAPPDPAHMIVHLLDYIAVDYPEFVQDGVVLDQSEYDEQLEFSQQVRTMLSQLAAHPDKANLVHLADELIGGIQGRRPGSEVTALAQQLRWAVIRAYAVEVAPKRPPDGRIAATLYQTQCSACHGPEGRGDGPAAASLDPSPSDFHERQRMDQRSVYGLYSTITLGVQGTAMSGFQGLSEDERWSLAFYVSNLGSAEPEVQRGGELWRSGIGRTWFPDLASLVTQTTDEVKTTHGDDATLVLSYLRQHPEALVSAQESPLMRSARLMRESLTAYRQGQLQAAQELAVAAYLDGFELVEATLDTVDRGLRTAIEAEMLGYRSLLKKPEAVAAVGSAAEHIQALLSEAQQKLAVTRLPPSATFFSAFVILLREGLEAILVLAAIFALLIKSERRDALPYVHAGWIAALALGGITWLVASSVIAVSGATREVTEGVTALVAAAVLLYVGFWMHEKAYADRWRTFLHARLQDALSARTMWALALVSFLAVYREAFEIVLFYQALWVQVAPDYAPVLGGLISAMVALAILGWLIFRGSLRLPLGLFFGATSLLLALLAVVFVGKGVAALQEAGILPINPVNIPSIPALGIYPNLQGLVLQVLIVVVIASLFAYARYRAQEAR
jgi:high-affinity iron transporter